MICGVGDYTSTLACEIANYDKIKVGVLTSFNAENLYCENVDVLPVAKNWGIGDALNIIRELVKWKPDLVHIQYPTLGYGRSWFPYFIPILLKLKNITVVQTWHEPPTRYRFLPNSLPKDTIIGVEPDFLQNIRKRYSWLIRRKKTTFIPIGTNIPHIQLSDDEREDLRTRYAGPGRRLVVNFGFAYSTKGLEQLFEIADPDRDTLLLMTKLDPDTDPYHQHLLNLINSPEWHGKVKVTGFLGISQVAKLLGAADAAVFPFRHGVGMRNGSFLAARAQGTFIITTTTSTEQQGFSPTENVFYAQPDDLPRLRRLGGRHRDRVEPLSPCCRPRNPAPPELTGAPRAAPSR